MSVLDCLVANCGVNVGISGSGDGLKLSFSFAPGSVWNDQYTYTNSCAAKSAGGGGGGGGGSGGAGGCCQPGACSPIIVDTTGKGFHFTDPSGACILFDLKNTGTPVCLSWPKPGSGNAWLVLPDADGSVHNSNQLFGNFTPQPNHPNPDPNGFLALAEYDTYPRDLVINKKDPVWSKLRLWIDEHCYKNPQQTCVSEPKELYTLESKGIYSIGLVYSIDDQFDNWGNDFKLHAPVNVDMGRPDHNVQFSVDPLGRQAYDVFLVPAPGQTFPPACI